MDRVPMTREGYEALKADLKEKQAEIHRLAKQIGEAAEEGDLKENAEYHACRERQGIVKAHVDDIEDKLARAEVIDTENLGGSRVAFGAWVTLEDIDNGEEVTYRIVGTDEANIDQGTISVTSPMARAMINREEGDEVKVKAPGGLRTYEVVQIRWKVDEK
ncbi:MAG: transcription elongation factor GreA [Sandaracinaceae bacterium]|nr:MAG: transcription elongation factor GreA [Sandaracinaceae bacterium]